MTRYGPFWIAATLVFIAAATGNLSSYLSYARSSSTLSQSVWTYDIKKVTLSAVLFYGYISVLPLMVRTSLHTHSCLQPLSVRFIRSCTSRYVTGPRRRA